MTYVQKLCVPIKPKEDAANRTKTNQRFSNEQLRGSLPFFSAVIWAFGAHRRGGDNMLKVFRLYLLWRITIINRQCSYLVVSTLHIIAAKHFALLNCGHEGLDIHCVFPNFQQRQKIIMSCDWSLDINRAIVIDFIAFLSCLIFPHLFTKIDLWKGKAMWRGVPILTSK